MIVTETYSRVLVGKNVSDRFPIRNGLKQGDPLSLMLFSSPTQYAIRRVQVNRNGLKLNGTHRLLTYADDVHILAGSIHTLNENAVISLASTRENGMGVGANKTKKKVMPRDENAG